MRILIVAIASSFVDALRHVLTSAGHDVAITTTIPASAAAITADVVVLTGEADSTIDACRRLRAGDPALPILLLTAAGMVDDRVAGLRAGADDCVEAPFHGSQMVARVDALARRAALIPALPEILEADDCVFDLSRCIAVRAGTEVALSAREAALVRYLHTHRARAVPREDILAHVFGVSPNIESRSVDVAIATLRRKIERSPDDPRIIVAVKGVGYAWGTRAN